MEAEKPAERLVDQKSIDCQIFLQKRCFFFFSFNFLKTGLSGISRELQFGVQEPCASLCKGREEDCFYRGQRKLGSLCKASVAFLG